MLPPYLLPPSTVEDLLQKLKVLSSAIATGKDSL